MSRENDGEPEVDPAIVDFLATGTVGGVRLGMLASEVTRALGQPEDRSIPVVHGDIWKYGPLQVTMEDDRVKGLVLTGRPR